MYICLNCHEFIIPKIREDRKYGTTTAICPKCGSDDIEEAVKCECCGEHFEDVDINDLVLCEKCAETLIGEINFDINRYSRDYGVDRDDLIEFICGRFTDRRKMQ